MTSDSMLELVHFQQLAGTITDAYFNTTLTGLNDHAVKMSVMTGPYPWHYHPNTDETFIGVEGIVIVETKDGIFEVGPGALVTIPANVPHCTRPKNERSVNLTIERSAIETVFVK